MTPTAYIRIGNKIDNSTIHQLALCTSLGVNSAFQEHNKRLAEHGGGMMASMDDNYSIRPPNVIFQANQILKEDLRKGDLNYKLLQET
jgi:hypothetical protein